MIGCVRKLWVLVFQIILLSEVMLDITLVRILSEQDVIESCFVDGEFTNSIENRLPVTITI